MKIKLLYTIIVLLAFCDISLGQKTYKLITSTPELEAGKKYIISNRNSAGNGSALGYQNTNNRPEASITVTNVSGIMTIVTTPGTSNSQTTRVFEIAIDNGTIGKYTLFDSVNTKYLIPATGSNNNNYLIGQIGVSDWTITFSSQAAVITNTGNPNTNGRNIIRYNNSGASLFSCYTSGQAPVYLYKEVPSGITSAQTGNWSDTTTWVDGVVPTSADNAIIANGHVVTMNTAIGGINTRNSGTTTTVNAGGTLATNVAYINDGTTTINGTFQINNGGYASGTNFSYAATGSGLIMNNNDNFNIYNISTGQVFWPITNPPFNVTINSNSPTRINNTVGTVAGTAILNSELIINSANLFTVTGTLQLNANGYVGAGNAPVYGNASLLRYNSGGSFDRGLEWTGASNGAGFPNNVQISTAGTSFNMGGIGTAYCGGNLLIDSSTILNTNTTTLNVAGNVTTNGTLNIGSDIRLGGNWTVAAAGTQNNNGKAVFFNGVSGNQTIAKTGNGIVYFDYLILDKNAGSTVLSSSPSTDVIINSNSGDVLQLLNAGALDLNGRTLTLNNNGGNISTNGIGRTITSGVTGGTIAITGTKDVVGTGTLILNTNVTTVLSNGLNFGSNKTTINGILQINGGGFANNNSPIYANNSTLIYNGVSSYGVGFEWTGNLTTAGQGTPQNVTLTTSSVNLPGTARSLAGNLTISTASTLNLNTTFGADLNIGGNWSNSGTFTPNSRLVTFNGTTAQTLTGATTFDFLTLNNSAGLALQPLSAVTVNQTLGLTSGKITIGANNLTVGNSGSITGSSSSNYVVTNGTGQLKRIVGASAVLFPVGNAAYNPITFNNAGTSDTYGVRVIDGAITTGVNNAKTVRRSWVTTEAVAGGSDLSVIAQYNTGEPDTGFAAATSPFIGFYNGTSWSEVAATIAGANPFTATSTANISPANLTNGTQYFAIGKDNAFRSIATKFVITAISPTSPTAGIGFNVTVRSQDAYNDFSNVVANTAFSLSTNGAAGAIGGTITGTILAGANTVTITGVVLSTASMGNTVTLTATRTGGDTLSAGTSSLFTVLPAASQLAFVGVPSTGFVDYNLASFTVEARRPNNSLDNTYTGNISIAIATGSGVLSGTLTVAAIDGVATFSTAQFDTATIYTINATSGALTMATSGNITITINTDFYRSRISGNWNTTATWESSVNGSTGWANATLIPKANNTVYIQSGHTINLTQNEACNDLNIASGTTSSVGSTLGKINLVSFTLSVNGKMRNYYAGVGTVPGTNQGNGYSIYPFTATTGKVSIVGTSRTVFNTGLPNNEWSAGITIVTTGIFPLEINMTDNSQVATFDTNVKCTSFNLVTGTVSSSIISADTGTQGFGNITIGTGTTLISSADSTFPLSRSVFQRTGNATTGYGGTLTIEGTLKLTGALPRFAMGAVINTTGTVEYAGANQTFMNKYGGGIDITYNNVTISGTGTKSLLNSPTVLIGDLNVNASDFVLKVDEVIQVKKAVKIDGGAFEIENNGQLIQIDDIVNPINIYSGNNTGNIIYNRTASQIKGYDYVYWASPVTGQDIDIYTTPTAGSKYLWNPTALNVNTGPTGTSGNWEPISGAMTPGSGYIIRGSSSYGMAATNIPAIFTGIPSNGIITTPISRGGNEILTQTVNGVDITNIDDNWNLIGNPYPSAIDALSFLEDNNNLTVGGFVWLWRHLSAPAAFPNPFYGNYGTNYNANSYITYNAMGSTPAGFNGKIAAGQGFFVSMVDGPGAPDPDASQTVTFKNTMRKENSTNAILNNAQFYRNSSSAITDLTVEKHRIWLNLIDISNNSVSTLVGYAPLATVGLDRMYDALNNFADDNSIYSLAESETLIIQGRPTPFDENDQVSIGVRTLQNGDYKIGIAGADGLFAKDQPIFLEDKLLNIIHDLRNSPYQFTSEKGRIDNRFVLRYTNINTLGTVDFVKTNQVIVSTNKSQITITSKAEAMSQIQIFDMLGRKIYDKKSVNSRVHSIADLAKDQVLIVKVKLQNGDEISNKIIVK